MGKEGSVNAQNNRKALKNRNNRPSTAGKMKKREKCGFWTIYYNMMDFAVFSFTSNLHTNNNNNKISTPLLLSYFQSDKLKYCYRVQY